MAIPDRSPGHLSPRPPSSSCSQASCHIEASQTPTDRVGEAEGPSYILGTCIRVCDPGGQRCRISVPGRQPGSGAAGRQLSLAVSEKVIPGHLQLLLLNETSRASGASRSPVQAFCLRLQESLSHVVSLRGIHVACFTRFHLGRKEPFSKTELENLSSRQIPFSMLRTHLKPSAKSS